MLFIIYYYCLLVLLSLRCCIHSVSASCVLGKTASCNAHDSAGVNGLNT